MKLYEKNLRILGVIDIRDKEGLGLIDMGDVSYCCFIIYLYFFLIIRYLVGYIIEFVIVII